jgi:hypothetical protein
MKNRLAIIIVAASEIQNKCVWPSYFSNKYNGSHDLIVVHRNEMFLPNKIENKSGGNVIFENKINRLNEELPNKAFGAYRYFYNKYKHQYDVYAFISDDVVFKRDSWDLLLYRMMNKYNKLGLLATQIFNGGNKYPHESHARAHSWFGTDEALSSIKWEFKDDHDGEMKICQQMLEAGFYSAQIGNKLDVGYDVFETNHIAQLIEIKMYGENHLLVKFNENDLNFFRDEINKGRQDKWNIISPSPHIGARNAIFDIEPFHGLLYDQSVELAKKYTNVISYPENINILG